MKYIFTITLLLLTTLNTIAQTKVRGTVTDAETGETLPFVNIVFANTTVGTISDLEGNFFIQGHVNSDTLEFSMVGYETHREPIKRNSYQEVNIQLRAASMELGEIVVLPGENPAWRIMRNVAANRKKK